MGKNKGHLRVPPDRRHDDTPGYTPPDPDALVRQLLAEAKPQPAGTRPHVWALNVVYMLDGDDEAQRLAHARSRDGELVWAPADDDQAVQVEGPYCVNCRKLRGPLAVATECAVAPPNWLAKTLAERELEKLGRNQRRRIDIERRRARNKTLAGLDRHMQATAHDLAQAATVRRMAQVDGLPEEVGLDQLPDMAQPEVVDVRPDRRSKVG